MTQVLVAATPDDLPRIANLHIASWQDAYRGILPQSFLDETVPQVLSAHWQVLPQGDWIVTVARDGDTMQGFIAVDLLHEGEGAYVDNLHSHPAMRGQGTGRRLLADTARQLILRGETRMWLTVLADNAPSRGFYRAMGGVEGPVSEEDMFGLTVRSLPVSWTDLPSLASLERADAAQSQKGGA